MTGDPDPAPAGVHRWFSAVGRFLLRLYPRSFRARYGAEMMADLEEQWRSASSAGRLRSLVGLARNGLAERLRPDSSWPPPPPPRQSPAKRSLFLDGLGQDLRHARRAILERPGISFMTVLTLALGIGANVVIFSVVHGVLWRALPYPEPERLVQVLRSEPRRDLLTEAMSRPDIRDLERLSPSLERLAGWDATSFAFEVSGRAEAVKGAVVTAGMLRAMGVHPTLGRDLTEEEAAPEAERTVVVSHGFWTHRLGSDAAVLGTTLRLDGESHEIVGVAPPDFDFPQESHLWVPSRDREEDCGRGCHRFRVVGLLAEETDLEATQAEVDVVAVQLEKAHPEANFDKQFVVRGLREGMVGEVRDALLVLQVAVLCVLLIVAANVANLMLAQGAERRDELAMRAALGAGRWRLARLLLTESSLLAVLGGGSGVALSFLGTRLLLLLAPPTLPRLESVRVDGGALAFAFLLLVVVLLLSGVAPALRLVRDSADLVVRRSGSELRSLRSRTLLLSAEVALSVVLLLAAGLLLRSFQRLLDVRLGFAPERVMTFFLALPESRYPNPERVVRLFEDLERQLEQMPGVESVGSVLGAPFGRNNVSTSAVLLDREPPPGGQEESVGLRVVTPAYFSTLRIPLVEGRGLRPDDRATSAPVVVVNEAFSRRFFPDGGALGKRLALGLDFGLTYPDFEIVGIVSDVRSRLEQPEVPAVYVPQGQMASPWMTVLVRSSGELLPLETLERRVAELDPALPVRRAEPMVDWLARARGPALFYLSLVGGFAVTALLLAAVGLYGVVACLVSRRRREIAIRIAVGADRRSIESLVLRQGGLPVAVGLGLGLLGAALVRRSLASLLYLTPVHDPLVVAAVVALLLVTALVAMARPVRRATRVPPAETLVAE